MSTLAQALNVATKLQIEFKGRRCPAHLYHLERQGDSERSRFIYRCKRPNCHHYSTLTEIGGRTAQCRNCGNRFTILSSQHIIKNPNPICNDKDLIENMFFEYPVCCIGEPKTLEISEVENLDYLEE